MTHRWMDDGTVSSNVHCGSQLPQFPSPTSRHGGGNVFRLLAWREINPRGKHAKRLWGEASKKNFDCFGPKGELNDARHGLISWVEAESLLHLSAKYSPLTPPPRSTIAAAFSPDGKTLASTHGDHTVKIIDCHTGNCLKVLCGHQRTPWVVRFHPVRSHILASGSLDQAVRLWDASTAECIGSCDFYRPIASIAFHAQGEVLAVASGHKLYVWNYNKREEMPSPTIVLKTRRSLRAVHFHPHGAPYLLTAEVNDLDSPDSPTTLATSGYLHYPVPTPEVFSGDHTFARQNLEAKVASVASPYLLWPTSIKQGGPQHGNGASASIHGEQRAEIPVSANHHTDSNIRNQDNYTMRPVVPSNLDTVTEDPAINGFLNKMGNTVSNPQQSREIADIHSTSQVPSSSSIAEKSDDPNNAAAPVFQSNGTTLQLPIGSGGGGATSNIHSSNLSGNTDVRMFSRSVDTGQFHQFSSFGDAGCWELPFLQGWLMGQTHANLHPSLPHNDFPRETLSERQAYGSDALGTEFLASHIPEAPLASSEIGTGFSQSRGTGRSGSRHRSLSHLMMAAGSGDGAAAVNTESDPQPGIRRIEGLAITAAAELPCTVKLRIWRHNEQDPCSPLDVHNCCLTVPHAVLCSEMGAHFSPCGRFFAACVACVLPQAEVEPGLQSQLHHDVTGFASSPTRHPISAHQITYELRIYSLEKATFGLVLSSRAIRAAHCLTSIQFSPTSEHILLAYGRRHGSLLRSLVLDGDTPIPIYTILEVYRVSDMELVRVLPSAEDEVNVACFHPAVGGGLVYGTKEGKLRILKYDHAYGKGSGGQNFLLGENVYEELWNHA